jgi:hypothetical protein
MILKGRWYLCLDDNYASFFKPKELTNNFQDCKWIMIREELIGLNFWDSKNSIPNLDYDGHHIYPKEKLSRLKKKAIQQFTELIMKSPGYKKNCA